MVYLFPQTFVLLLLPIASSFPYHPSSPLGELSKRLDKPPVPSVAELSGHLRDPDRDTCMFYTGFTHEAAELYAEDNDLVTMGVLDIDGWVDMSLKYADPEDPDEPLYNPECPLSDAFQQAYHAEDVGWSDEDGELYFDRMSEAFARKCSGEVFVSLPPTGGVEPSSVFYRIEFPVLTRAGTPVTKITAVHLLTGEDPDNGDPLQEEYTIWPMCGSTPT